MHRRYRCLRAFCTAIIVVPMIALSNDTHAQTTSPPAYPASPASPVAASAPANNAASASKKVHKRSIKRRIRHRRRHRAVSEASYSYLNSPKPSADSTERLDTLVRLGDGVHVFTPSRKRLGVRYAEGDNDLSPGGAFKFVVHRDILKKYLVAMATAVKRDPIEAHPVVDSTDASDDKQQVPAHIVPGQPGCLLDINATISLIKQAIEKDPTTVHIVLPIKITKQPKVSTSELQGINARIGYFDTHFNPGEVGRTMTVRKAISIINGTIVKPGSVFSINQTVGERTAERGFGIGHVFVNGKMEKQLGGGMCQVATTLFNAAMLADLKIVERHQHVRTVPYVVPGRDATVYWGHKDFKIQNDTDTPIYISYRTTRNHAICSIYGKSVPGRQVKLVSHHRRLGERHFTGVFYRVTTLPDGTVKKDKRYYSDYQWTPALDYSH